MYFPTIQLEKVSENGFFLEISVDFTGLLSRGSKHVFLDITHSVFDFLSDH